MICRISISQDGHWAGGGDLDELGYVQNCWAILGPVGFDDHASGEAQEAAERAYDAIEDAIRRGEDSVELEGVRYTWTISYGCECGALTGERCQYEGDDASELVEVEYTMPRDLRASHEAADNGGRYPQNGARRLMVHRDCADLIVETEGEWAHRVVA